MPRMLMFLSLAFVCAACQQADRDVPAAVSADEQDIPVHVTPSVAYEHACADCHETGKNDAPRTGDPSAWADRSALWEAVLFEHANAGYGLMPGAGGDPALQEYDIDAAAEYIMSQIFPGRGTD